METLLESKVPAFALYLERELEQMACAIPIHWLWPPPSSQPHLFPPREMDNILGLAVSGVYFYCIPIHRAPGYLFTTYI